MEIATPCRFQCEVLLMFGMVLDLMQLEWETSLMRSLFWVMALCRRGSLEIMLQVARLMQQ